MQRALLLLSLCLLAPISGAQAQDVAGSSDHRLFPRIAGYFIGGYEDGDPVIERFRTDADGGRDSVEGRVTVFRYELPGGAGQRPTTRLGTIRYYEDIVQRLGGTVLYRAPAHGELSARLVSEGREVWLALRPENTHQFVLVVAERSAPVQASSAALALMPAETIRRRLATRSANRLTAAAARFALDTSWTLAVFPSRGARLAVVTIRGLRVEDATSVRFGDWSARILARGASEIAVVVPERPAGATLVTVLGPSGARTTRDSFLVYQDPIQDNSQELRVYGCTEPRAQGAPEVIAFEPATVRTGDTLTIRGRRLGPVVYVSFTFYMREGDAAHPLGDRDWTGNTVGTLSGALGTIGEIEETLAATHHRALPFHEAPGVMRVIVPHGARTGPVALFGYGECVASDMPLAVRVGPAPR